MSYFQQEMPQVQECKLEKKQRAISLKIGYLKIKISDAKKEIEDLDDDLADAHEKFIVTRSKMEPLDLQIEKERDRQRHEELSRHHLSLKSIAESADQQIKDIEDKIFEKRERLEGLLSTQKILTRQLRQAAFQADYKIHSDL